MTLFIIVSEKEWETCSIARVSVTCYQWGLMKHLFYRVSKDNKGFHVDSRWSGLSFSEDSCSRNKVISSFIYIVGLILYINKSSATTASHLVALLVMQIPKSQWGPTFVDNTSQGTMQSTEMFCRLQQVAADHTQNLRSHECMPCSSRQCWDQQCQQYCTKPMHQVWLMWSSQDSHQISELCAVVMMLIL